MAIERVSKVAIIIHQSNKEEFLNRLQRLGVLHIVRIADAEGVSGEVESRGRAEEGNLNQILGTIELLDSLQGKKSKGKVFLDRMEYERIAVEYDIETRVKEIQRLTARRQELEGRLNSLHGEISRLKPWERLNHSVAELGRFSTVKVLLGKFPGRQEFLGARSALSDKLAVVEEVSEDRGTLFAVVLVYRDALEEVTALLNSWRWEGVDLKENGGLPAEIISQRRQEQEQIKAEIEAVQREIFRYTEELPRLKARVDAILNQIKRAEAEANALRTDSLLIIYGWIRERDYQKLVRLVEEMKTAVVTRIQPAPGEEPPVALVNRRLWKPFELVLELYQLPLPNELDPTWLIAPFFGVFFALCLTDAGYGIIVAMAALLLMRKIGKDNKLLGIILIGGILTIPAGALVGGWFGDIPDRLGIPWLLTLKNKFLWFDPMKEPMKFFVLSLTLGYLQLIAGITFEIVDCARVKNYGDAFLGQLPWFLFINSLVFRLILLHSLPGWANALLLILTLTSVAGIVVWTRRENETMVSQALWFFLLAGLLVFIASRLGWLPERFLLARWAVLGLFLIMFGYAVYSVLHQILMKQDEQRNRAYWLPLLLGIGTLVSIVLYLLKVLPAIVPGLLGTVFYFWAPAGKKLLKKFVWGGYALYGATSYIGVLLSYIRLMALGMCTGGVAMAINVIAWMVLQVPIVGILMALIVLVIGHTYNIAVNVLGAFVHSLRLQYVEFFPRFYTGGGEPFVPFKEVHQFVVWKS
jgi:V/A-type H+-transporting ATPase subunit I